MFVSIFLESVCIFPSGLLLNIRLSYRHNFACFALQCRCAGWSCLQWGHEDTDALVRCHTCDTATLLCYWMTLSTSGVGATIQRAPATYFMPLTSVSRFKLDSEFFCQVCFLRLWFCLGERSSMSSLLNRRRTCSGLYMDGTMWSSVVGTKSSKALFLFYMLP